jgi:hypothetical protein
MISRSTWALAHPNLERVLHFAVCIALAGLALAACTPEAVVMDPPGDGVAGAAGTPNGGDSSDAGAGNAPQAGAASSEGGTPAVGAAGEGGESAGEGGESAGGVRDCAPLSSTRPGCTECLSAMCADEVAHCAGNDCTCGDWNGSLGQFNCLLACPTFGGMKTQVEGCAAECGFQDLMHMEPNAHALFDCLVNPPAGPPLCESCFPPPEQ